MPSTPRPRSRPSIRPDRAPSAGRRLSRAFAAARHHAIFPARRHCDKVPPAVHRRAHKRHGGRRKPLRTTRKPADDRNRRHHSVRRVQALRCRACAGRRAAGRTARRLHGAARLRQQQELVEHHGAHQDPERDGLRGAAVRHARLRRERGRARQPDLPRAGRGHQQRADVPDQAPGGRSQSHRGRRLELRRRGRGLYRRRRSARRGGDLERRLGRRRAQVPRPASRRPKPGRSSPTCWRSAAATAPSTASR